MKVSGSVPILPTEDPNKVLLCIENVFPGSTIEVGEGIATFSCDRLDHFCDVIADQRIRDTAGMVLRRSFSDGSTFFFLNKQAAFMGKINFTEGRGTLGDIKVEVQSGADELVRYLAPEA